TLDKGLNRIGDTDCLIIPWIQAFGLQMRYTEREILLQLKAAEDLGIDGFLFWNAGNKYSVVERALKSRS
ncbi:MAG: putative glycoside hydrolase, partial [Actinobacteria bacterium]|nr:putative glycoside hydrolase [Actinomycetota bacterium]